MKVKHKWIESVFHLLTTWHILLLFCKRTITTKKKKTALCKQGKQHPSKRYKGRHPHIVWM